MRRILHTSYVWRKLHQQHWPHCKNRMEPTQQIGKIRQNYLLRNLSPKAMKKKLKKRTRIEMNDLLEKLSRTMEVENKEENSTELTTWIGQKLWKNKKAPSPDGIKSKIYKKIKQIWTPYQTRLLTECLKRGRFPKRWKEANLIVFLKSQEKTRNSPRSYRPICLLNVLGKFIYIY